MTFKCAEPVITVVPARAKFTFMFTFSSEQVNKNITWEFQPVDQSVNVSCFCSDWAVFDWCSTEFCGRRPTVRSHQSMSFIKTTTSKIKETKNDVQQMLLNLMKMNPPLTPTCSGFGSATTSLKLIPLMPSGNLFGSISCIGLYFLGSIRQVYRGVEKSTYIAWPEAGIGLLEMCNKSVCTLGDRSWAMCNQCNYFSSIQNQDEWLAVGPLFQKIKGHLPLWKASQLPMVFSASSHCPCWYTLEFHFQCLPDPKAKEGGGGKESSN